MNSVFIPGRSVIRPTGFFAWLLWALFGNADDGALGTPDFHPTRSDWIRRILWWRKNPAHNMSFYVLGAAHLDQRRTGRYPSDVFAPLGGLNWAVSCVAMDVWGANLALVCLVGLSGGLILLPLGACWAICLAFAFGYLLRLFCTLGWMPFISYSSSRIRVYLGWRERSNFGIKLNISLKEIA